MAWRIKVSLQWSGWLQYIPNMMVAVLVGLLLLIFQYLHLTWTATIFKAGMSQCSTSMLYGWKLLVLFLRLSGNKSSSLPAQALFVLLLAILLFDLVTVKMNLRPTEGIPSRRDHLDVFDVMRQRRSGCKIGFNDQSLVPFANPRGCFEQQLLKFPEVVVAHGLRSASSLVPFTKVRVWCILFEPPHLSFEGTRFAGKPRGRKKRQVLAGLAGPSSGGTCCRNIAKSCWTW